MRVHYICKGCGTNLATAEAVSSHDPRLGLDLLSPEERRRVLTLHDGALTVHTYCDWCAGGFCAPCPSIH